MKKLKVRFNRNVEVCGVKYKMNSVHEIEASQFPLDDWFVAGLISDGSAVLLSEYQSRLISAAKKVGVDEDSAMALDGEMNEPSKPESVPAAPSSGNDAPSPTKSKKSSKSLNSPKSYKAKPDDGKEYKKGPYGRWYEVTPEATEAEVPSIMADEVDGGTE